MRGSTRTGTVCASFLAEHDRIRLLLDLYGRVSERLARVGSLPAGDLEDVLALMHGFVERHHHEREELLLRALEGETNEQAYLARLGEDHDRMRSLIAAARALAPRAARGDRTLAPDLVHLAREYLDGTRDHMRREEEQLFPLAERALVGEPAERLASTLEADLVRRAERLAELDGLQARLVAAYGPGGDSAGAAEDPRT